MGLGYERFIAGLGVLHNQPTAPGGLGKVGAGAGRSHLDVAKEDQQPVGRFALAYYSRRLVHGDDAGTAKSDPANGETYPAYPAVSSRTLCARRFFCLAHGRRRIYAICPGSRFFLAVVAGTGDEVAVQADDLLFSRAGSAGDKNVGAGEVSRGTYVLFIEELAQARSS